MRLRELTSVRETATPGATVAGNIATVANPILQTAKRSLKSRNQLIMH